LFGIVEPEACAFEFNARDLTSKIRRGGHDTVDRHQGVFDAAARILGRYGSNRKDLVAETFADVSTGCPRELLDLIERDHVRVVVQTQKRRAVLFHDVRLRYPAALAQ
jgi:hypothetical protein